MIRPIHILAALAIPLVGTLASYALASAILLILQTH